MRQIQPHKWGNVKLEVETIESVGRRDGMQGKEATEKRGCVMLRKKTCKENTGCVGRRGEQRRDCDVKLTSNSPTVT